MLVPHCLKANAPRLIQPQRREALRNQKVKLCSPNPTLCVQQASQWELSETGARPAEQRLPLPVTRSRIRGNAVPVTPSRQTPLQSHTSPLLLALAFLCTSSLSSKSSTARPPTATMAAGVAGTTMSGTTNTTTSQLVLIPVLQATHRRVTRTRREQPKLRALVIRQKPAKCTSTATDMCPHLMRSLLTLKCSAPPT